MSSRYLGLDVGGTKCAAVVGTGEGRILHRVEWPADAQRGPDAMIGQMIALARPILQQHDIAAIGVSIGGPLDAQRGVILSPPNLPGWDNVPLRQRLETALERPVCVEHDGSACALAEWRWGVPDARRLIYLTCGTGFGMGLVVDGRIYRGAGGQPSDIGHIHYSDDGPIAYGRAGSLEAFAAGGALPRLAAWRFPQRWGAQPPTGARISQLAADGDADARQVIQLNAQAVGRACAMLIDLLYPDRISLGSLCLYLGAEWLAMVHQACEAHAMPGALACCRIAPAALEAKVQDLAPIAAAM